MYVLNELAVSPSKAMELVGQKKWFHGFDVAPNVRTPGSIKTTPVAYIESLKLGALRDLHILECGTFDGPVAYTLAARGADVVATDIQDPDTTGFNTMREISGINIPYVRASIYELDRHFVSEFDVVLYNGIWYHLKHPLLAFEQVAHTLKNGGRLFCEGEGLGGYFSDLDGKRLPFDPEAYEAMRKLDGLGVPVCYAFPGTYQNGGNWFLPNRSAVRGWLRTAGFDQINVWSTDRADHGMRVGANAVKSAKAINEWTITGASGDLRTLTGDGDKREH